MTKESEQYYETRKKELQDEFNINKDRAFQKILNIIAEWQQDSQRLQQKFQELNKKEEESKKIAEDKSKVEKTK